MMSEDRRRTVVWDAHSCLPLDSGVTVNNIAAHARAGFDFVSINVGMDPTGIAEILKSLAWFRAEIARQPDAFKLVGTIAELDAAQARGVLAVAFDLEGSRCLFDQPEMIRLYADLGVRQMHLAYNRNNSAGGGCLDDPMHLTSLGRLMVYAMNDAGVIVDCSHSGELTSFDIMEASTKPVVFSHANVAALAAMPRNLSDDQIRACAATGGVVGICGYGLFLGAARPSIRDMVRHIDYVAQLVGIDHVGLGWDHSYPHEGVPIARDAETVARFFPHALLDEDALTMDDVMVPLDQRAALADELSQLGYDNSAVAKVMGENFRRVASVTWPT